MRPRDPVRLPPRGSARGRLRRQVGTPAQKLPPAGQRNRVRPGGAESASARGVETGNEGMPPKNDALHGNVPDDSQAVRLPIDVLNDLEVEGDERVLAQALPTAKRQAELKRRAPEQGAAINASHPTGRNCVVLKSKHAGFCSTTLDSPLTTLKATTLILAGITSNDASMRDFHLVVPADRVVSLDPEGSAYAVRQMGRALQADTTPPAALALAALQGRGARRSRSTEGLEHPIGQHATGAQGHVDDRASLGGAPGRR
jgi:hypothetical protein